MYQVIDDKKYNINEKFGLSEDAKFSEVISVWEKQFQKMKSKIIMIFLI